MRKPFAKTLSFLDSEEKSRAGRVVVAASLLIAAWVLWLQFSKTTVYAVSDEGRLLAAGAASPIQMPVAGIIAETQLTLGAEVKAGAVLRDMSAFYTDRDEQVRRLTAAGETRIVLPEVETPAHRLFADEGLAALPADFADADSWPANGGSAEQNVLITGQQVIVHVGWTVTMPRALAELLFKAGARVDTEIDHAHHRLVVVARLYPHTYGQTAEERETNRAALASVRAEVDALLRDQPAARWPSDEPTPHAWRDEGHVLELGLVPRSPCPSSRPFATSPSATTVACMSASSKLSPRPATRWPTCARVPTAVGPGPGPWCCGGRERIASQ